MTVLFDSIFILFGGRILGGLSSTLMYSVFESWMVTEYHRQHMDDTGGSLSDIFGLMTTLNGIIAILAGLFAEAIVDFTKNQEAPFLSAVICLVLAFSLISNRWVSQKEAVYYPI
jgi:MFS family permease